MGPAIQAGGPAISRCRNRELNTAGPGTAEEGASALAGLRFGGWPAKCPCLALQHLTVTPGQPNWLVSETSARNRSNPKLIVRVRFIPGFAPRSRGPVPAKAGAQIVAGPADMR
jgi:hypothetical protein